MDKKESLIRYLVHLLLIILFIIIMSQLSNKFGPDSYYRNLNPWLYFIIAKGSGVIFGGLLALEYLHQEREKIGKWRINYLRLLALGVPALMLSFPFIIYFNFGIYKLDLLQNLFQPLINSKLYTSMFEVMVGYVIGTSFIKKEL